MSTEHLPDEGIYREADALYRACHRADGPLFMQEFYALYLQLLQDMDDAYLRRSRVFHLFAGSSPPETCAQEPTHVDLLLMERVREIHGRLHRQTSVTLSQSTPETSQD